MWWLPCFSIRGFLARQQPIRAVEKRWIRMAEQNRRFCGVLMQRDTVTGETVPSGILWIINFCFSTQVNFYFRSKEPLRVRG
jgi:hypothetical protein